MMGTKKADAEPPCSECGCPESITTAREVAGRGLITVTSCMGCGHMPAQKPEVTPATFEPPAPAWKKEIAALQGVCEALEPLDPAQRKRAFGAVLCSFDDDAAAAAIAAWQRKHG